MAAAGRSARLAAWGGTLRRGFAASRRAVPNPGPLAAAVAGVALAGTGAAWLHGRVNVAPREGSLTVLAQVWDAPFPRVLPGSALLGRPWAGGVGDWGKPDRWNAPLSGCGSRRTLGPGIQPHCENPRKRRPRDRVALCCFRICGRAAPLPIWLGKWGAGCARPRPHLDIPL
jgi:hypothetical protein